MKHMSPASLPISDLCWDGQVSRQKGHSSGKAHCRQVLVRTAFAKDSSRQIGVSKKRLADAITEVIDGIWSKSRQDSKLPFVLVDGAEGIAIKR